MLQTVLANLRSLSIPRGKRCELTTRLIWRFMTSLRSACKGPCFRELQVRSPVAIGDKDLRTHYGASSRGRPEEIVQFPA